MSEYGMRVLRELFHCPATAALIWVLRLRRARLDNVFIGLRASSKRRNDLDAIQETIHNSFALD